MIAIGVDPGLTGAIAAVCSQRGLIECDDLPVCPNGTASGAMRNWIDAQALDVLLQDWSSRHDFAREDVVGFIERPIAMPGRPGGRGAPVQTIATQFDTFGVLRAMLQAHMRGRRPINVVDPKAWKALFGLKADKTEARDCCMRLYPSAPVTLKKHHNRAEAILIAHWGKRTVMGREDRRARHEELCNAF